eukprot:g8420.t1
MSDSLFDIPELADCSNERGLVRIPMEQDVPFTRRVRAIVDTPAFQRLGHITQLGLASRVYPGATHTRFEHALGVFHNATRYLRQLARDERFRDAVDSHAAEVLLASALLHDLGHWPFCHPIEDMALADIPRHEEFAAAHLAPDTELADVLRNDWNVAPAEVLSVLNGDNDSPGSRPETEAGTTTDPSTMALLRSILSGPIDIDKMDYLDRDSLHAGVPYGRNFDRNRLIQTEPMQIDPEIVDRLRGAIRTDRLLDTAVQLVGIPSPTCDAAKVSDKLAEILTADGFDVERPEAGWPKSPAVAARLTVDDTGRTLQFNGHLDTVHLPFVPPRVENGMLYGSGASDMKGGVAAAVEAMRILKETEALPTGSVLLTAHDLHEAPWGDGSQVDGLIDAGYIGDGVLLPEYLCDHLPVLGRGLAVLEVTVTRDGEPIHEVFSIVQLCLVLFFALLFAANSVAQEKDRQTLIMLLMTDLSDRELVLGKLCSSLLIVFVLIVASVPAFFLVYRLGGVTATQIGWSLGICLATALAAGSWGSLVAYWREKTFQTLSISVLGVVMLVGVVETVVGIAGAESTAGRVVGLLNPFRAMMGILSPLSSHMGTDVVHVSAIGSVASLTGLAAVLNIIATMRLRVWNPSRSVFRKAKTETDEATGIVRARTRTIWNNPVIWREIRTKAYGRKAELIKLGYFVLAAAAVYSVIDGGGELILGMISPIGFVFVALALMSLMLVNAQAVTAMTSERDMKTLELLLMTDVTAKEFVFGKLGGIFYNAKEVIAIPLLLAGYSTWLGYLSFENLVYVVIGFLVLVVFSGMLGLHSGLSNNLSRHAIANSLGTMFFLFVGIFIFMLLLVEARSSFFLQLPSFIGFIGAGSIALYASLSRKNPSMALRVASAALPFLTFYSITEFLLQGNLGVCVTLRPDRLLTAILFWNLLINLGFFATSIVIAQQLVTAGYSASAGVLGVGSLFIIILMGEVLPKSGAVVFRRTLAPWVSWPLAAAVRVLDPVLPGLGRLTRAIRRAFWPHIVREPHLNAEDLERAVEVSQRSEEVVGQERQVLHNILDLSEITVEEVMRPRGTYVALPSPVQISDLNGVVPGSSYIAVQQNGREEIDGAIPLMEFAEHPDSDLDQAAEDVVNVPWCATLADTLQLLRDAFCGLACVVNEYGETVGIVTYEDIIDTVLMPEPSRARRLLMREPVVEAAPGRYEVEGMTTLRYLCRRLNLDFEPSSENYVTVAGMLYEKLEHIPSVGDECEWNGFQVRVAEVPAQGHLRVELTRTDDQ